MFEFLNKIFIFFYKYFNNYQITDYLSDDEEQKKDNRDIILLTREDLENMIK